MLKLSKDENNNDLKIIDSISNQIQNINELINVFNETKKIEEYLNFSFLNDENEREDLKKQDISEMKTSTGTESSLDTTNLALQDNFSLEIDSTENLETSFSNIENIDLDLNQTVEEFKRKKLKYESNFGNKTRILRQRNAKKQLKVYKPIIKRAIKTKDSIINETSLASEIKEAISSNEDSTLRRSQRFRVQAFANLKPIYALEYLTDTRGKKVRVRKCIGYEEISNDLTRFEEKFRQTRLRM